MADSPVNCIYVGGQLLAEVKVCPVIVRYGGCDSQRDTDLEGELECRTELGRGPEGIK